MNGNIFCRLAMRPPVQPPALDLPPTQAPAPDLPATRSRFTNRSATRSRFAAYSDTRSGFTTYSNCTTALASELVESTQATASDLPPAPDLPAVQSPASELPVFYTKKRSRTALTIAVKLEILQAVDKGKSIVEIARHYG